MGQTRRLTPTLAEATLVAMGEDQTLLLDNGVKVRPAASCLLRPEPGDRVLVAQGMDGTAWILAVLARARPETPATLTSAAGFTVLAEAGPVIIKGAGTVGLVSDDTVLLAGATLSADADQAVLRLGETVVSGEKAEMHVGIVRLVADRLDSFVSHALHRLKTVLRLVEDADRTEAREVHVRASEQLIQRGHVASLTAREDVRIDADRIHIG
jgi:hypothetical protein